MSKDNIRILREYVEAYEQLQELKAAAEAAQEAVRKQEQALERLANKVGSDLLPAAVRPVTNTNPTGISAEELRQRTLAVNKKLRGDSTIAICQALPGTITELTERSGVKKTSVSTILNRLVKDGIVKKGGEAPIPGYENRTTAVYELAV